MYKITINLDSEKIFKMQIAVEGIYNLNHLGNVHEVITDRKIGVDDGGTSDIDYYDSDVISYSDYYPFGWLAYRSSKNEGRVMPGRNANSGDYRYGFNGMEDDDEVKGDNNSYDFGARMYDSRVGRWMSTDPLEAIYPMLTPYNFAANSTIILIDPDGRKIRGVKFNSKTGQYEYSKSALKRGTNLYIEARLKTKTGRESIANLIEDKKTYDITVTRDVLVTRNPETGKYAVLDGETIQGRSIVISLNKLSTKDLIDGNQDKIKVVELDEFGFLTSKTISKSDLEVLKPNSQSEFAKQYIQAGKDSGYAEYDIEENKPKTEEQELHRRGAHEETHLTEEEGMSVYESEKAAFENEIKEAEEYKNENPNQ